MNLYRLTLRRDGERYRENREIRTEIITEEIYYAAESIAIAWSAALVQGDGEIVGIAEVVRSIILGCSNEIH